MDYYRKRGEKISSLFLNNEDKVSSSIINKFEITYSKKRQTLLTEINNPNSQLPAQFFNTPNDNANNMSNKRKEEAQKDLLRRRAFSQSICIPEWMVEIPTDLQENWICIPRPDGKRFILSSKKGKTVLYGINGYSKVVKSDLPGGMYLFSCFIIVGLTIVEIAFWM